MQVDLKELGRKLGSLYRQSKGSLAFQEMVQKLEYSRHYPVVVKAYAVFISLELLGYIPQALCFLSGKESVEEFINAFRG